VVHAFSQIDAKDATQVILSYPVIDTAVGLYNRKQFVEVPALVTPGKWRYTAALDSDCSGKRIVDQIVKADIEIVAKNK